MNTKDELWKHFLKKNPAMAGEDGRITIARSNLKKLVGLTWDVAYKAGEENANKEDDPIQSLFGKVFGRNSKATKPERSK